MCPGSRRYYRVKGPQASGIKVELREGSTVLPVTVEDVSIGGLGVVVQGEAPFRVGSTLQVHITAPQLNEPLVEYGRVRHVQPTEGGTKLGIEFIDWMGLVERIPSGLASIFNRRRSPRTAPEGVTEVRIYYEAEGVANAVEGRLVNLSCHGLAFLVNPVDGARLLKAELVLVSFRLPGSDHDLCFRAQLRHISGDAKAWRLGAFFDDEGFQFEERKSELARFIGEQVSVDFPTA